jgi:phenylpropionate dioxygenase-like ring-hydroxylating dioxygenase large terminal subunit
MDARGALSLGRQAWDTWPRYDAAALGFREYWYPVLFSRQLGRKPVAIKLLGETVMFVRDRDGKAYALQDRCPHRGVPLALGKQEFPGSWSCWYHGWTYDLSSGVMVACLTDGPDSPLCGKVRVRSYPLQERLGLVWIFMGDGTPPPVEADIPSELMENEVAIGGRLTVRPGNWRYAVENGFDEGHAKYLHRDSLWTFFRRMPAYTRTSVVPSQDGVWITRVASKVAFEADYPVVGKWPPKPWWKMGGKGAVVSVRMPGALRVKYPEWTHYEWYVPVDDGHHRYLQLAIKLTSGFDAWLFKLRYWAYIRWIFHGLFNDQDAVMVETMNIPPERLYRPDVSIIAWRKLCERPRGSDGAGVGGLESALDEHAVEEFEQEQATRS